MTLEDAVRRAKATPYPSPVTQEQVDRLLGRIIDLETKVTELANRPTRILVTTNVQQPVLVPKVRQIKEVVKAFYHLTETEMVGVLKSGKVVGPRQIAMYFCHKFTNCSQPEIGRQFGGRDHTTVLHACRKTEERISSNQYIAQDVATMRAELETMFEIKGNPNDPHTPTADPTEHEQPIPECTPGSSKIETVS